MRAHGRINATVMGSKGAKDADEVAEDKEEAEDAKEGEPVEENKAEDAVAPSEEAALEPAA